MSDGDVLYGEVITDGVHENNVHVIVDNLYADFIKWHNGNVSQGADPQSGLHGLPHIPWDEKLDGAAAMHGNGSVGAALENSGVHWVRVGGEWVRPRSVSNAEYKRLPISDGALGGALGCALLILLAVVLVGLALLATMET